MRPHPLRPSAITAVGLVALLSVAAGRATAQPAPSTPPTTLAPTTTLPAGPTPTGPAPTGPGSPPPVALAPPPTSPGWWDVAGRLRQAINGFFRDLVAAAMAPTLQLVGRSLLATCEALAATSHASIAPDRDRAAARQVVADCDRRLGRYRAALEAGTDPSVVGQWIAEVTATRQAAQVVLHDQAAPPPLVSTEQVRRAIQELGGLLVALDGSDPALRAQLYQELGIEGTYDPHRRVVVVRADLGRPIERVGGGT
jgi:hypothetical protein